MTLRQTVLLVAFLNLVYFGVEFAVAIAIGSVSLFADSVDFLEDASLNLLIATVLGWQRVILRHRCVAFIADLNESPHVRSLMKWRDDGEMIVIMVGGQVEGMCRG
jgi:hypothetical protein